MMSFRLSASLCFALLPPTCNSLHASSGSHFAIRLASRRDLLPLSAVIDQAFAQTDTDRWFGDVAIKRMMICLDIERRSTPWDERHAQFVAENSEGKLLGFAELWLEVCVDILTLEVM